MPHDAQFGPLIAEPAKWYGLPGVVLTENASRKNVEVLPTSTASEQRRSLGIDEAARRPDSVRLRVDARETRRQGEAKRSGTAVWGPGDGSRRLTSWGTQADVPITGLFFTLLRTYGLRRLPLRPTTSSRVALAADAVPNFRPGFIDGGAGVTKASSQGGGSVSAVECSIGLKQLGNELPGMGLRP